MDPPPSNSDYNKDYIRVLLYSYYTTITGWGVLLSNTGFGPVYDHWVRGPLGKGMALRLSKQPKRTQNLTLRFVWGLVFFWGFRGLGFRGLGFMRLWV